MIVFSASMPKAGSAWFHNLTAALVKRSGGSDAFTLLDRYDLGDLARNRNATLARLDTPTLSRLLDLHLDGHRFAVKTHAAPSVALGMLMGQGAARCTYILRDPRDAILSAMEHGAALRGRGGSTSPFARLATLEEALDEWAGRWLPISELWRALAPVMVVRYEDLHRDPLPILERLAEHVEAALPAADLREVVAANSRATLEADPVRAERMHLNRGVLGRHREVMTLAEQERCLRRLGPSLVSLGYEVSLDPARCGPGLGPHIASLEEAARRPATPGQTLSPRPDLPATGAPA